MFAELQTQFQKQLDEHKAELQTQFQKQFDEHKADNAANQAQAVKAALEGQRLESAASEAALRTELSSLQSAFSSMQSTFSSLQSAFSSMQSTFSSLQSAFSSLQSENAVLSQKLSETVEESKQRDQEKQELIQELQTMVSSQGEKLLNIDLEEWEKVNEAMVVDLPRLQATIEELRRTQQQQLPGAAVATPAFDMSVIDTKHGALQTECRQMLAEQVKKQHAVLNQALQQVGKWVDELREKDDSQQHKLQEHADLLSTLSAAVPNSESRAASAGQRPPAPGSGAVVLADRSEERRVGKECPV